MTTRSTGRVINRGVLESGTYQCQHPWPDDCHVQCGGDGIVFTGRTMEEAFSNPVTTMSETIGVEELPAEAGYRTAFFEAFPRQPKTFLRGEGETIEAAETAAWEKYQRHTACDHPAFEKRGYENGLGFCVKCGMSSSKQFAPWEKCPHCDYPIYPNERACWHCDLLIETAVSDAEDSYLVKYKEKLREAARWLMAQDYRCPDCGTAVKDMRIVSSCDYRLTDEELQRQDRLYYRFMEKSLEGKSLFSRPDKLLTFPASVFFECKCDQLKLIVDLVGPGTAVKDES